MSYNSGLELPKVAFSEITYSLIPLGSFFVGFDLDIVTGKQIGRAHV